LEEARKAIGELARTQEDLLLYALYPTTGKEFLQKKYSETQGADT
jgi:pyruvate carboxylase subunit B